MKYWCSCMLFFFFNCKSKEVTLSMNFQPAEKFIQLINYLESKNEFGFNQQYISEGLINKNFQSNSNDISLNNDIDKLLSLPIYTELAKVTSTFVDSIEYKGKEGYRKTFLNLPVFIPRMRGDVSEQWIEFWENHFNLSTTQLLNKIKTSKKEVTKDVIEKCYDLLPEKVESNFNVEIIFCLDGNRGSYTKNKTIVMDMLDFPNSEITTFNNVLAHELHHVIYGDWLYSDLIRKNIDIKNNAIFNYQRRIILEGIAQQITYSDYSQQAKELYNNSILLEELFLEWINGMRKVSSSKEPNKMLQEINNEIWRGKSYDWLEEYASGEVEDETFSRRPTPDYYISYHLYNSIYQKGGLKKLHYVIKNYDCLLEEYNKIYSGDLLLPKIPNDILLIWKNTFNNSLNR